jgi:sulfide dehydrogenase cytochrome subunit
MSQRILSRPVRAMGIFLASVMSFPLFADPAPTPQASGEMMGNTCAGCHGTHGRMVSEAFMPLAGMKQSTFIKAMTDFRSGSRPATLMGHVARGYNDEQIKAMADYFAAIKP